MTEGGDPVFPGSLNKVTPIAREERLLFEVHGDYICTFKNPDCSGAHPRAPAKAKNNFGQLQRCLLIAALDTYQQDLRVGC